MYAHIQQALRRGEVASALQAARDAAAQAPFDPQAHCILAIAQATHGDRVAAHASLDQALILAPHDAEAHYQRAVLLFSEHRMEQALCALERCLALNPNELRAYAMQAQWAFGRGDRDEAERLLKIASRIDPEHPWLLTLQGMLALQRGQSGQALSLLSRALQGAPESPQTLYALGLAFLAEDHLAFAEHAFRRLLERNPHLLPARHLLIDSLRRQGRLQESVTLLKNAPQPLPDSLRALQSQLRLVARSGNPQLAQALAQSAPGLWRAYADSLGDAYAVSPTPSESSK